MCRLILGSDNQRLHEELIEAGGYLREGRFARMNEGQLREALKAAQTQAVPESFQQRLREQWERHHNMLLQALEARMRERSTSLQNTLAIRAKKEQDDIRAILTELKESILRELHQPEAVQLELSGFSSEERQQYERDLSALTERATQIDGEIEQEVARIQQRFANPQPRLFPVAVTYLVPEHLIR